MTDMNLMIPKLEGKDELSYAITPPPQEFDYFYLTSIRGQNCLRWSPEESGTIDS